MMIHLCPLELGLIVGICAALPAPLVKIIRQARTLDIRMPKPDLVADDLARWQAYQVMRQPDPASRMWSMVKLYCQLALLGVGLVLGLTGLLLLLVK